MKGKREADNNLNFSFKSEKLDELRSRVDAAFDEAASYEGLANVKAPQARKTYSFTLTKDTKCYSVGGEGAPQQISIDQVAQAVSSQSGLGVIIEVRGDNVLEVRLAS